MTSKGQPVAGSRQWEAEERFRKMMDEIPHGMWACRADGGDRHHNRAWREYVGAEGDGCRGQEWLQVYHPDDREALLRAWTLSLQSDGLIEYSHKVRIRRSDGVYRWMHIKGAPLRDETGRTVKWVGTCAELDGQDEAAFSAVVVPQADRRRRSEDLPIVPHGGGRAQDGGVLPDPRIVRIGLGRRACEQHLRWALQAASGGAWSWEFAGGEVWWSPEMYELWDVVPGTPLCIEDVLEMISLQDRERLKAAMDDAANQRGEFHSEFRINHPARGERWMAAQGRFAYDEAGKPMRLLGLTFDITSSKDAELELRRSRMDLDRAQEVGQIGSWRLDIRTNALTWSDENYRIFGVPTGTPLTYQNFLDIVHPDDREYVVKKWQAGLHGEPYDIEHRIVVNEQLKWVREKAYLEFDEQGRLLGGFGITQDITERKLTEEALRQADGRKDEFLAMLSHELRNPLAPIRNAVEILREQSPPDEAQFATPLAFIERQVEHMSRLLDDLLDVTRISIGRIELRRESLDMGDVVQRAVEASLPFIESRRHELQVRLPKKPLRVKGDDVRLAQVISNLLNNAAKYTDPNGQISLSVGRAAGNVLIRIRDNGRGIHPDALPHVFDMFYQGNRSSTGGEGGLGIGLSLVRKLVTLHGGVVDAHSEGAGQGSEFVVRLPELMHETECKGGDLPGQAAVHERLRILVVDDCRDIAESLTMLLNIKGYEAITAYDGNTAVEMALAERPHIVLLDIGLPGMSGYEVAKTLRDRPEMSSTWLVAMSGYGQPKDMERSQEAGFDRHLVKPVDFKTLQGLFTAYANPGAES